VDQVALRGARLGAPLDRLRVASSASLPAVLEACAREEPEVLVVDSIQTLEDEALEQSSGSVVQVRECAASLVRHAKSTGRAVLLVGHVTKEGSVAGPKTLEHVVDAVVTLEGDRSGGLRLLRAVKNRFGSCEETGVYTMTARGLEAVPDPSSMLLADRRPGAGSVVHAGLEGTRPVLVEMQALVVDTRLAQPRRVAIGVDQRRLAALLAVLAKSERDQLASCDVFVAAVGGLTVREPAGDLAAFLALSSALDDVAVDPGLVALGEVGLGGEVRRVPGIERRLAEAARLGFTRAIVPRASKVSCADVDALGVDDVGEAIAALTSHRVALLA
jgi:DNA repair protein RadA/Sms